MGDDWYEQSRRRERRRGNQREGLTRGRKKGAETGRHKMGDLEGKECGACVWTGKG